MELRRDEFELMDIHLARRRFRKVLKLGSLIRISASCNDIAASSEKLTAEFKSQPAV